MHTSEVAELGPGTKSVSDYDHCFKMSKAKYIVLLAYKDTSPPTGCKRIRFFSHREQKLPKLNPDTSIRIVTKIMQAGTRSLG